MKLTVTKLLIAVVVLLLVFIAGSKLYYEVKIKNAYNEAVKETQQYYEPQLVKLRNEKGQEASRANAAQISEKMTKQILAGEIKNLEERFNTKIGKVQSMVDLSVSTSFKNLKIVSRDTTLIYNLMDTLNNKLKVFKYDDGYNQFTDVLAGDTLIKSGKIRNKIVNVVHAGPYPRWIWKFPAVWKSRPVYSDVYLYNPMSGTDTVKTIVANPSIKD